MKSTDHLLMEPRQSSSCCRLADGDKGSVSTAPIEGVLAAPADNALNPFSTSYDMFKRSVKTRSNRNRAAFAIANHVKYLLPSRYQVSKDLAQVCKAS